MAIRELKGGEACSIPVVPLRVTLSGVTAASGVAMRILEGTTPASVHWMSPVEAVITPSPRTLTIVVEGADGALIPAGTLVGLHLRADIGSDPEQIIIAPTDVGARRSVEYATVIIAPPTITVQVPSRVGGGVGSPGSNGAQLGWSAPGAYAFREAFTSVAAASVKPWAFLIDGSVSMIRRLDETAIAEDIQLVAGIVQEWMHREPRAVLRTSVRDATMGNPSNTYPLDLIEAARENSAPASWLHLAPAIEKAAALMSSGGLLVAVLDGLPGDLDEVSEALRLHPSLELRVVIQGPSSSMGYARRADWFEDELAPLAMLTEQVTIVSLGSSPSDSPSRNVELAATLAGEHTARAVT